MYSTKRTAGVVILTFVAAIVGMLAQFVLPTAMLTESKGSIGTVIGLVTLLLALVLGLLIWTSYGVFATQVAEAQSLAPAVIALDFALEQYGPEAIPGRRILKAGVLRARDRFFGDKTQGVKLLTDQQSRADMHEMNAFFASLDPKTDDQRDRIATAKQLSNTMMQTQMLMSRQLANPVPSLLLTIVLFWSSLLFLLVGVIGAVNPLTVATMALGAISVASAFFLIMELAEPYSGFFRINPTGIDLVLQSLIA